MGIEKGLWCWCLVLGLSLHLTGGVVSSEPANESCTSRCGIITNISYPFRLPHDPPHCGHPDYELACENNITLLHLRVYIYNDLDSYNERYWEVGRYRVMGINYNNFTIRLVDAGIQDGNCSALPLTLNPLSLSDLEPYGHPYPSYRDYYDESRNPYSTGIPTTGGTEFTILNNQVGYLECSDAVKDDAAYVDTAPCLNRDSKGGGYVYAVAGNLLADNLKPQCRVKSVALIASDWEPLVPGGIKSYADIQTLLSFGFQLSWWPRACADLNCSEGATCYSIPETRDLQCVTPAPQPECTSPLGIVYSCRLPKLRIVAEDYVAGIITGLYKIVGQVDPDYYSAASHFTRSNIAGPLGIVTGRFVLPFITARFLFGSIFLSTLLIYIFRRRHLSMYENIEDFIRLHNLLPVRYSYKDLKTITKGFKNKLGKGGFGTVLQRQA